MSKNKNKHIKVLQDKHVTYLRLLADVQQQESKLLEKKKEYDKSFPLNEREGNSIESNQRSVEFVEEILNDDEMDEFGDMC